MHVANGLKICEPMVIQVTNGLTIGESTVMQIANGLTISESTVPLVVNRTNNKYCHEQLYGQSVCLMGRR